MSVWPSTNSFPPALEGSEGELISVSIAVEPRDLESLLEALAAVDFPINPQIYHRPVTVVEFPAYTGQVDRVGRVLGLYGFAPGSLKLTPMLQHLRAG